MTTIISNNSFKADLISEKNLSEKGAYGFPKGILCLTKAIRQIHKILNSEGDKHTNYLEYNEAFPTLAKVNAFQINYQYLNPLCIAAKYGHLRMIQILSENGANPSIRGNDCDDCNSERSVVNASTFITRDFDYQLPLDIYKKYHENDPNEEIIKLLSVNKENI